MRVRTSDALRREIEDDIEHGRLSPGDKLDEQTLAERFEDLIRVAPTHWHLLQPNWPSDRKEGSLTGA